MEENVPVAGRKIKEKMKMQCNGEIKAKKAREY
jgi:hypothetical protein